MRYPGWIEGTPSTDSHAKVNKYRPVQNVRVIKVQYASFRKATFDGIFELEVQGRTIDPIIQMPSGKMKVIAICSWYGCTSNTTYPHIDITNADNYMIIESYSGDVVDNIGKRCR